MDKIRTLIVDDEPLAQEGIRYFLDQDDDIDLIDVCSNGPDALDALDALNPDLVFLDVQMPEMDGFDVLSAMDPHSCPIVIFVTAYDEHALRAFEVHALDYILKPYTDERFMLALQRAKDQIYQNKVHRFSQRLIEMLDYRRQQQEAIEPTSVRSEADYLHRLVVKSDDRIFFIKTHEIDWIEAADYFIRLHIGPKSYVLRETLSNLARRLDPNQFQRIHRSTVVNLDRILSMEPYFQGNHIILLKNGTQLTMSRHHRHRLESILGRTLV